MSDEFLGQLIQEYGIERFEAVVNYAQGKNPKNLGGYIRKALKQNWKIPKIKAHPFAGEKWSDFAEYTDDEAESSAMTDGAVPDNDWMKQINESVIQTKNPVKSKRIVDMDYAKGTPGAKIKAAWHQLELQLDKMSWETFMYNCEFSDVKAGVYIVEVYGSHAQAMLQHRLYRNIRRVLSDIIGEETELEFRIKESEA